MKQEVIVANTEEEVKQLYQKEILKVQKMAQIISEKIYKEYPLQIDIDMNSLAGVSYQMANNMPLIIHNLSKNIPNEEIQQTVKKLLQTLPQQTPDQLKNEQTQ